MAVRQYDVTEQLLEYGSEVGQWDHLNFLNQVVAKWAYQVSRGSVTPGVVLHLGDMIVEMYDVTQYKGTMLKDDGTYFEVRLPVSLAVEFMGRSRWGVAYKVVGSCLSPEQARLKAEEAQAKLDAEVEQVELAYHEYVEERPGGEGDSLDRQWEEQNYNTAEYEDDWADEPEVPWGKGPLPMYVWNDYFYEVRWSHIWTMVCFRMAGELTDYIAKHIKNADIKHFVQYDVMSWIVGLISRKEGK